METMPRAEHPFPQFVREDWTNLNGTWDFAFDFNCSGLERGFGKSTEFPDKILVPFCPESKLSGIGYTDFIPAVWYHRTINVTSEQLKGKVYLHFGAVDYECMVFVNGTEAGSHKGGYVSFALEISSLLKEGENHLVVYARDDTRSPMQPIGKQSDRYYSHDCSYTRTTGIWQTVWLELVPENHIVSVRFTPDYDAACCHILVKTSGSSSARIRCGIRPETEEDARRRDDPLLPAASCVPSDTFFLTPGKEYTLPLPDFTSWTPENPFLYHADLDLDEDHVECYFAMRKCDIRTDAAGLRRIFLNNAPYMQTGVLDQGYWPDGLYTAPCDEAFLFDIRSMKELGFNMIRKHIKIEPQRWYYHCDRLGMLVWQDMVCGGTSYRHWFVTYMATLFNALHWSVNDGKQSRSLLSRREEEGQKLFYSETRDKIEALYNHPSIVCWVPFNEGWGQFDALKAADFIRILDPGRLIDHASGWFDQKGGDLCSLHYYFFSLKFTPEPVRALALPEFGGYSWKIPGHSYSEKLYGYGKYDSRQALTEGYRKLLTSTILPAVEKGISATIYTQLSDVEEEVNGLYTYDREILKPDKETVIQLNRAMKDIVNRTGTV